MEKPRQCDSTDKTGNFMMTGIVTNLFTAVSSLYTTKPDPGSKYYIDLVKLGASTGVPKHTVFWVSFNRFYFICLHISRALESTWHRVVSI